MLGSESASTGAGHSRCAAGGRGGIPCSIGRTPTRRCRPLRRGRRPSSGRRSTACTARRPAGAAAPPSSVRQCRRRLRRFKHLGEPSPLRPATRSPRREGRRPAGARRDRRTKVRRNRDLRATVAGEGEHIGDRRRQVFPRAVSGNGFQSRPALTSAGRTSAGGVTSSSRLHSSRPSWTDSSLMCSQLRPAFFFSNSDWSAGRYGWLK